MVSVPQSTDSRTTRILSVLSLLCVHWYSLCTLLCTLSQEYKQRERESTGTAAKTTGMIRTYLLLSLCWHTHRTTENFMILCTCTIIRTETESIIARKKYLLHIYMYNILVLSLCTYHSIIAYTQRERVVANFYSYFGHFTQTIPFTNLGVHKKCAQSAQCREFVYLTKTWGGITKFA